MITFLHGTLVEAAPHAVVIEVHGVGYEVQIPLSSFDRLPPIGQTLHLLTHFVVREDAHLLFGFLTSGERDLFRLLIHTVSGIGPKIALNVLSGMSVASFQAAVAQGDTKALARISGLGKKTAERIVVELKDKLASSPGAVASVAPTPAPSQERNALDAVSALVALGVARNDAVESVRAAQAILGAQASVEALIKASLKKGA